MRVVFVDNGTDNGIGGGDDAVVIHDTADQLVQNGGELIIDGTLVDDNIGGIEDELREAGAGATRIGAIDSHDRLGDNCAIDDLGDIYFFSFLDPDMCTISFMVGVV